MKLFIKLAIAACIAVVAGITFLTVPWPNSGVAFAKVLEQVQQARSVRFTAMTTMTLPGQKEQSIESTMLIAHNRMRQETLGMVTVIDFKKGEILSLQPKGKTGMRMTMQNMPPQVKTMNLIEEFRNIKAEQAKDLGDKDFDGRKLHGFLVEQPGNHMTVWADPKTKETVRIEATIDMPAVPKSTSVFKDFKWGLAIDESEISLEVPADFKVQSMNLDASMPSEKDLIEGIRLLATLNGGEFPVAFDAASMGKAFGRYAKDSAPKPEQRKDFEAEMMPKALKVGRGLAFINPAYGEDFHYAGKGVKLDAKEQPVMWYKPAKLEKYRVIYADLTVKEVSADAVPAIDAQKLPQLSPPVAPGTATK